MGRKKINREEIASCDRFLTLLKGENSNRFVELLHYFYQRWKSQGFPEITETKKQYYDDNHNAFYHGLYYEIRQLCDDYGLVWPFDLKRIGTFFQTLRLGTDSVIIPEGPSPEIWRWFRMAKNGLGLPRKTEYKDVRKFTPSGKKKNVKEGLTYEDMKDVVGADVRTVGRGITACWDYLLSGGDLGLVREYCELSLDEFFILIVKLHLKQGR